MESPRVSKNAQLTNLQNWENTTFTFQHFPLFPNFSFSGYYLHFEFVIKWKIFPLSLVSPTCVCFFFRFFAHCVCHGSSFCSMLMLDASSLVDELLKLIVGMVHILLIHGNSMWSSCIEFTNLQTLDHHLLMQNLSSFLNFVTWHVELHSHIPPSCKLKVMNFDLHIIHFYSMEEIAPCDAMPLKIDWLHWTAMF